ncbi:hypothetical protein SCG7086_BC_00050 [Chlamydiales bacterium SCGC AG-110-P3]|nr:hypothetical protein SCG7086_BC_00050 [Chlamydiales bacterium SCGC AG-110-P3]
MDKVQLVMRSTFLIRIFPASESRLAIESLFDKQKYGMPSARTIDAVPDPSKNKGNVALLASSLKIELGTRPPVITIGFP